MNKDNEYTNTTIGSKSAGRIGADEKPPSKISGKLRKILRFLANPRLLLCIVIAWLITNGWSYILFGLGTYFNISWMTTVAGAYIAFLWLPVSPEKIVTFAISLVLLRLLFPNDQKTLAVLKELLEKAKSALRDRKKKGKCENEYAINEEKEDVI